MNATAYAFEQPITERPEIPARFGEDGGKFYYYYDQLADELDEDLTKRLKSQLDSLLIFAGLFAGVNSAFLALTLPMMSADPTDDTNALLLQLVKGGNVTINSEADLPSATFSPSPAIYPVNILFAVSLTCALMSSFLAVLGQQWLVYYRKRSCGGAAHQRKEQLRRQLGAQRWRLELVLDDILPGLLQIGLVIFCIAFILYLRTLSESMSSSIAVIVGAALAITVGAAVCATWGRMCPYQSPLSHLLCWTMDRMRPVAAATVWVFIVLKVYLCEFLWTRWRGTERRMEGGESGSISEFSPRSDAAREIPWKLAQEIMSRAIAWVGRKEETANDLIVATVKRVILTSEQPAALIHAATNICAIDDEKSLRQLLSDTDFFDRLHDLFSTSLESSRSLPAQLRTVPEVATKAFASAILHLALSVGTITDLVPPKSRALVIKNSLPVQQVLSEALVMTKLVRLLAEGLTAIPRFACIPNRQTTHLPPLLLNLSLEAALFSCPTSHPLYLCPGMKGWFESYLSPLLPSGPENGSHFAPRIILTPTTRRHLLVVYFYRLAASAGLEENLWAGDLKDVNHLLLLGILLQKLFLASLPHCDKIYVLSAINSLARFTTSHQLLSALCCAVKVYIAFRQFGHQQEGVERYKHLPQLFEAVKTTYEGRHESLKVPFILEALELLLKPSDDGDLILEGFEVYQIGLDIFRHACELNYVELNGVFASVGRLMRYIELDIRGPVAQTRYGEQILRGYKHQYVEILERKLDQYLYDRDIDELGKSLAETLRYIREVAAKEELGHPENRTTLNLFKSIHTRLQTRYRPDRYPEVQLFMEECETFEAWIDTGGYTTSPGRLNCDPEVCWCPYAGR